jgi:hypothetical protein
MSDEKTQGPQENAALDRLMQVLWLGAGLGLLALLFSNLAGAPVPRGTLAAAGIGVLIFLSAFASGAFLGFLFGVPRAISREPSSSAAPPLPPMSDPSADPVQPPPAPTTSAQVTAAKGARLLQSNTNLEKISDWLTTLLVGAGLAELHNLNDALLGFRQFLAATALVFVDAAGRPSAGVLPAVGPILLIFGAASGFLYMYLNTRLVLVRMFNLIERVLANDERLPAAQERAVKAFARDEEAGDSFVKQQFATKKSLTIDDALSLMFDLLYKSQPQTVIDLGAQLSATEAVNRPDYWYYLAAAFGQKLHHTTKGSTEWISARDNALDCARRAVALNIGYRDRLWAISNPDSFDNDLAPLRDDLEFRRIVGRPLARPA